MRAPDLRVLAVVALAAIAGCAAQDAPEVRPAPPTALDAPAPGFAEPIEAEPAHVEEELGFAEYERLLVANEDRLRAAGVLVAVREETGADSLYAPPPPADAAEQKSAVATQSKAKRTDSAGFNGGAAGKGRSAAPEPTAPAAPVATRETARRKAASAPKADSADLSAAAEPEPAGGRCQTICDLSSATCDLEARICDLAQRHAGDPRYGELCRRADDDCRVAADACQRCSP